MRISTLLKRIYHKLFGNEEALNRYLRMRYIVPLIEELISEKLVVLDMGCGDGEFTRQLEKRGAKVIAVDRDWKVMGTYCRTASLCACDLRNLPFKDNSFDFIFCSDVFEHMEDFENALPEAARVLREKRACLISTVSGYWETPIRIRKRILALPQRLRQRWLGRFNLSDEELHEKLLGHIRLDLSLDYVAKTFEENGFEVFHRREYCQKVGSLLMEIFFSANDNLRFLIFPFLKLCLPLDGVVRRGKPWQFIFAARKSGSSVLEKGETAFALDEEWK